MLFCSDVSCINRINLYASRGELMSWVTENDLATAHILPIPPNNGVVEQALAFKSPNSASTKPQPSKSNGESQMGYRSFPSAAKRESIIDRFHKTEVVVGFIGLLVRQRSYAGIP